MSISIWCKGMVSIITVYLSSGCTETKLKCHSSILHYSILTEYIFIQTVHILLLQVGRGCLMPLPQSLWTKVLRQLKYWANSLVITMSLLRSFSLYFPLQNKKQTPCWVSLSGGGRSVRHLPLPLRPLGDAQPVNSSSPTPLLVSTHPALSSSNSLPLVPLWSLSCKKKKIFLSFVFPSTSCLPIQSHFTVSNPSPNPDL